MPQDFPLTEGLGVTAYLHEREAQEIEASPLIGIVDLLVILGQTDAPDSIDWARFNKDAIASLLEKLPKFNVLCELGLVGADNDGEAMLKPSGFIKTAHLAPQGFGGSRVWSSKNLLFGCLIAEERSLLSHHEMLRRGVLLPIYDEGGTVPLAEAGCGDAMLAGLVAPEEDELQLLSSIEAGPQVFE